MSALAVLAALAAVTAAPTDYVRIVNQVDVPRPVAAVWARVGGYCAIAEWMATSCRYASGTGDPGTVRLLRDDTIAEVMVARTPRSYTYWQTTGTMAATGYHGTLAIEPLGSGSRLVYTLVYDQARLSSDALRASERARLTGRFADLLGVMRRLAMEK